MKIIAGGLGLRGLGLGGLGLIGSLPSVRGESELAFFFFFFLNSKLDLDQDMKMCLPSPKTQETLAQSSLIIPAHSPQIRPHK